MMGVPIAIGWAMHFMIGIVFALLYTYLLAGRVKINVYLKGALFGVVVFIIAQIAMTVMGAPKSGGPMMLSVMGSLVGHIIFGTAVSKTVGDVGCKGKSCRAAG